MDTRLQTIFLSLSVFGGILGSATAEVVVEPHGALVAGKTIAAWTTNWWRWAAAMAPPGDAFTDVTGEFAGRDQSGPVFLLAGSPGGSNYRTFSVPANTYLLVPLLAGELSQLELGFNQTAAQIRLAAQQQANQIDSLHATLDGVAVADATLFGHRELSPNFSFAAVANNQVNIPAGASGIAVADGYFLMIAPPTPGDHVLNYGGGATTFGISIDETDTITVLPPLALTAPAMNGGEFGVTVTGPDGSTVVIETSSDLRNWQPAATNSLSGGSAFFSLVPQNQSQQFYRARQQP